MILALYYLLVAVTIATALVDWRKAIYLCLLLDVVRDPVRKLTPGMPVATTVVVGMVWLAIFAGVCFQERERLAELGRRYPQLRTGLLLLLAALVPGALISTVSYAGGWLLVAIGGASYLFPALGLVIGFALMRNQRDVLRLLAWYCVVNTAALSGAVFEYLHVDLPALGGMGVHWVRHQTGYAIDLVSGFYRSPDILGMHAAHVTMFGGVLMKDRKWRWLCVPMIAFAIVCLVLCGRRKMLMMPLIFLAVLVAIGLRRSGARYAMKVAAVAVLVAAALVVVFPDFESSEYVMYAETTRQDGWQRIAKLGSFVESVRQAGIFGYGLGTATQGNYYAVAHGARTWQEDGLSRLAAELGVPGAALLFLALWFTVRAGRQALRSAQGTHSAASIQDYMVALLAANGASFLVSHQAYSGDPSSLALVSIYMGILLSGPVVAAGMRGRNRGIREGCLGG